MDFTALNAPNRSGRGGRTATSTSTPRGTTSIYTSPRELMLSLPVGSSIPQRNFETAELDELRPSRGSEIRSRAELLLWNAALGRPLLQCATCASQGDARRAPAGRPKQSRAASAAARLLHAELDSAAREKAVAEARAIHPRGEESWGCLWGGVDPPVREACVPSYCGLVGSEQRLQRLMLHVVVYGVSVVACNCKR
jgi:hypothetical protein